jgi:hypothetical protein
MNGCEGILGVSADAYPSTLLSKLECLREWGQVQPFVQKFQPAVGRP